MFVAASKGKRWFLARAILLAVLCAAPTLVNASPPPRILHDAIEPNYTELGFHEHGGWCVTEQPEIPPGLGRTFNDQHCPAIPGSLVPSISGIQVQAQEIRILRVIVDMDDAYVDALEGRGINVRAKTQDLMKRVNATFYDEVGVRVEVVLSNIHGPRENYTQHGGRVSYDEYLALATDFWKTRGPAHDLVLLLTGYNLGPAGIGKIGTAGHPDLVHAAYVKEVYAVQRACPAVGVTTCIGPDRDAWMVQAILHEVSHTLSNRHEYGLCSQNDVRAGCTIMVFNAAPPQLRAVEFSEIEEFYVRAHAETHLLAESEYEALILLK